MYAPAIQRIRTLLTSKQFRFIGAGLINTLIDFAVFNFVLHVFDAKLWIANLCSTSVAMIVSFALNKRAVFSDKRRYSHRQFVGFVLVTAAGLWGLQTVIIIGASNFLTIFVPTFLRASNRTVALHWLIPNLAKFVATVISAVWNYFWYDRVIFAKQPVELTEWM